MDDMWEAFETEVTDMLNESVKAAFIAGYDRAVMRDYIHGAEAAYQEWVEENE